MPPIDPPRILIVEDNPGDVDLLELAFSRSGLAYSLYVVDDGDEAIEFLRRRGRHAAAVRPALVLLDINLSGKSGFDVLAEVKRDEELRRIPVCVLTSSSADVDIRRAYDLHANCYVTKPTDFKALLNVIAELGHFWFDTTSLPTDDPRAGRT